MEVKFFLCSRTDEGVSLKLTVRIIQVEPKIMSKSAGKSNLQIMTSFKKKIAKPTWHKIAVAELKDRSTISANGVAPIKVD